MLRILTRRSALAICQANTVSEVLKAKDPSLEIEIIYTDSIGDKIRDRKDISKKEIKRKWTLELEIGLEEGLGDLAIHCGKDLGVVMSDSLVALPILEREDPRDIFVSIDGRQLSDLKKGDRVGTSSTRRKFQLEAMVPGIEVVPYSGNVTTRIDKEHMLKNNVVGAVIAAAGVIRLGRHELAKDSSILPETMVPAMNQGILMAQFRKERSDLADLVSKIANPDNDICCSAERHFIKLLGASCETPIGIYAKLTETNLIDLFARTIIPGGRIIESHNINSDPIKVAEDVAEELLRMGYMP